MENAKKSNVVKMHTFKKVPYTRNTRVYSERPIRLWDCRRGRNIRSHYYKDEIKAIEAAAKQVLCWSNPGDAIDVYHSRSLRHLAQFKKNADGTVTPWINPNLKSLPTSWLKDDE